MPSVTARMMRDGPGGIVALQLPSGPVVAVASWLNAARAVVRYREDLDWLAGQRDALAAVVYSPWIVTGVAVWHVQRAEGTHRWAPGRLVRPATCADPY